MKNKSIAITRRNTDTTSKLAPEGELRAVVAALNETTSWIDALRVGDIETTHNLTEQEAERALELLRTLKAQALAVLTA